MIDEKLEKLHQRVKNTISILDEALNDNRIREVTYYKGMVKVALIYAEENYCDWAIKYLQRVPDSYFEKDCLEQLKTDDKFKLEAEKVINKFYVAGYLINTKGNPNVVN